MNKNARQLKSTNQVNRQTIADDEWGTMNNTENSNASKSCSSSVDNMRKARATTANYTQANTQNCTNCGNTTADSRQANSTAVKNSGSRRSYR